jgi:hypothetical protein
VSATAKKRLRPGELDSLVLAYAARPIAKAIGRSSGAVANCLARMAKEKRVRQAKRKPRAYVVREVR